MFKLEEGIHLIAYVTDKKSGESTTIEDYDYNSKKQFEQELKNNGYKVISILDNRDMFLLDNTNYTRVSQIQKELRQLKKDIEDSKDKYPALYKSYINDYNNLKDVYDKVMKISLTEGYVLKGIQDGKSFNISFNDNKEKLQKFKDELQKSHKDIGMYIIEESFNYLDDTDKPKYNDYIGLSMQIDGTKTKIKTLKSKINKDKYDVDKNKHKYQLNYYKQLLNKYEDAMNNIKDLKESTTIKAKYKPMVKDFYKTPTGTWMIDLNDGYVTSYGTNYIEAKTKTQCIYELENEVSQGEPGKSLFESNVIPIKKGQMKILNIGGDGIAYKVSIQDAVRLQNAGYQIFLPQGSRKSIYARAGDIEDYNNGFNVDGEKLQENLKDIVLYHGSSNTNLTYLDIGKSTGNGDQLGRGIYLTTNYEQAQSYAGNNGKVYKVKLDDSLKLFNLNDKLSDSIKQQLIKELENSNNKDIKNYICMFNRKVYDVKDKQEGLKFYQDKQKEWEQLDGKYFGNRPKVVKNGNNLQVIYTDYSDIQSAINNMTGENLIDTLRGDIDPDVFVTIITNSGYDGVITNNNHWYVIYRDINKVHILNENRKFGNKNKLEEVSRNELLVKTKGETITRYNKAASYKGFNIVNIYTDNLFKDNTLTIVLRVGKYNDVVQLEDVLYWIQIVAENKQGRQINTKGITEALMNAIDGMDIKIDCECRRFPL